MIAFIAQSRRIGIDTALMYMTELFHNCTGYI